MANTEEAKSEQIENTAKQTDDPQKLPKEFYAKLLHLPACKTKGYCDNCGRCER